jgi:hypothetical protein
VLYYSDSVKVEDLEKEDDELRDDWGEAHVLPSSLVAPNFSGSRGTPLSTD